MTIAFLLVQYLLFTSYVIEHVWQGVHTCLLELDSGIGRIDRNVVLEPHDGWLRSSGSAARQDRAAVLLDGLQRRALNDPWISIGIGCKEYDTRGVY